jgi:hypothetical protein
MDVRRVIEDLVPEVAPNATVVEIREREDHYEVTIAGTSGVLSRCQLSRASVERASAGPPDRRALGRLLKRCADRTIVSVPDGRD